MLTNEVGELWDPSYADLRAILRVAEEHPGAIAGIKLRASANTIGGNAPVMLPIAREAADELGVPLMVHIGMAPPTIEEVLPYLRDGDVLTHCFHPHAGGRLLDGGGRVRASVREAVARGVRLDVGHGVASASHAVAAPRWRRGWSRTRSAPTCTRRTSARCCPACSRCWRCSWPWGCRWRTCCTGRPPRRPRCWVGPNSGGWRSAGRRTSPCWPCGAATGSSRTRWAHRLAIRQALEHRATVVAGRRLEPYDDGRIESHASAWATRFGADTGGRE